MRQQMATYPELFTSRRFWGYALCMAFSIGAFYAFLGGAPLVAKALFDMSPAHLGFWMGTITAGFMFGSFLSGKFAARHKLTTMIITGRLVACTGLTAGLVTMLTGFVHPYIFFGATLFVGIGNGLTTPSANAGALSVRPRLAGSAAGLSGALTIAGGALISGLTGTILTPANAGYALLAIMLAASFAGLLAALCVLWIDRRT